jgi:hypothetical protein
VPLTVSGTRRERGPGAFGEAPPFFGWWTHAAAGGAVRGALVQTPPRDVMVSALPDAAVAPLARLLAGRSRAGAVRLPRPAAALAAARGWEPETVATSRLHRLAALTPPEPPPAGRPRIAGARDRALLTDWTVAFCRDAGAPEAGAGKIVDDRLAHGGRTLWEDPPAHRCPWPAPLGPWRAPCASPPSTPRPPTAGGATRRP